MHTLISPKHFFKWRTWFHSSREPWPNAHHFPLNSLERRRFECVFFIWALAKWCQKKSKVCRTFELHCYVAEFQICQFFLSSYQYWSHYLNVSCYLLGQCVLIQYLFKNYLSGTDSDWLSLEVDSSNHVPFKLLYLAELGGTVT